LKNRLSARIAERASIAQLRQPDNLRTFVSAPLMREAMSATTNYGVLNLNHC
jgi:hypothetical protein